jgi:DNA-binding NtrC family response regulator
MHMALRKLLCVAAPGFSVLAQGCVSAAEWDAFTVADLRSADRLLRNQDFLVGLMMPDVVNELVCEEMDNFLRAHWTIEWVGAFYPQALAQPACRELILDHFCDFHTRPVDAARLSHTLGHAYGFAALRQAPPAVPEPQRTMGLIGQSAAMVRLRQHIVKVAHADAPVLIWGESGSGKELTARAIHNHCARAAAPFVAVNCGAIPASLIQSELFGYERGAFTGAVRDKHGLIESAGGGTIFLDEIGDLPLELQSNLLRFLQEKTICRVGSTQTITVDVRVIAASHVNLQQAADQGHFRNDLLYRLNVLPVEVPPLRERKDDLLLLATHFFNTYSHDRQPRVKGFSSNALQAMGEHDWPGNVRELINRVRRAMVMTEGRLISPLDLGLERRAMPRNNDALDDARFRAERCAIHVSLQRSGKNITRAARDLGVSRMTLYRLMEKHGINP